MDELNNVAISDGKYWIIYHQRITDKVTHHNNFMLASKDVHPTQHMTGHSESFQVVS